MIEKTYFLYKKQKKIRIYGFFFVSLHARMNDCALHIGNRLLAMNKPLVMGIINVTPDSFAISCQSMSEEEIQRSAATAIADGADILDIGGMSARPDSQAVSLEEEWSRVERALKIIRKQWPNIPLSVDTYRAEVAHRATDVYGVEIINDISGGELDEQMFDVVARSGATYVLMHMRGTPATMSGLTEYDDLMSTLLGYFAERVDRLHQLGVSDVILDPGFGFAKNQQQNYEILSRLADLQVFRLPILAGLSRKRMIYNVLGSTPQADDTLLGTCALNMAALLNGANILRVHDVAEAVKTIQLFEQIRK